MEHYVTIFDSLFLPQGLALRSSLERHAGDFTLWVICVDEQAHAVLKKLALPNLRAIPVAEIENDRLRAVKSERTRAEYCWTLTPFAPAAVLALDASAARVTYVDADLWFRKSPARLFAEFEESGKAVLITDHAYAPDHDQTATSGQYCVQFMTFARGVSESILSWWQDRCIEWCFARFENGRFGDQKYLDDWPERFPEGVHVLRQEGLLLAPWNATRFPYGPAVAFHFHGLRLLSGGKVLQYRGYDIPRVTHAAIYPPYLDDLAVAVRTLSAAGEKVRPQGRVPGIWVSLGIVARRAQRVLARMRPVRIARLPGQ